MLFRKRLLETGMFHSEWQKDVFSDVLLKRLTTHSLHNVPGKADSIVRISWHFSRRKDPSRLILDQEFAQRHGHLRIGHQNVANLLLEPAGVRHQVSQCDGLA